MALIHAKSGDGLGIPGITYAQSMINENKEEYNLVDGAMPNGKATGGYWKGSLGAMGTYYIASLAEMGLVAPLTDNMHLYNITKKTDANYITGEHLADAFEKSVGKESSLLFLKCLSEGIVNNNELDILVKTFKAKSMNIGDETNLLIAMLLQHDNPAAETKTYMRRNTIQLLLNYFITNEVDYLSELKFARYVYNEFKRGNTKSVSAIGWYAYYLNDSRQYESLIIFSELLKRLNNSNMPGGWELIENITSDLADEVCIDFAIESETYYAIYYVVSFLSFTKQIIISSYTPDMQMFVSYFCFLPGLLLRNSLGVVNRLIGKLSVIIDVANQSTRDRQFMNKIFNKNYARDFQKPISEPRPIEDILTEMSGQSDSPVENDFFLKRSKQRENKNKIKHACFYWIKYALKFILQIVVEMLLEHILMWLLGI